MDDSFGMHITKKNYFRVEKHFLLSEFINIRCYGRYRVYRPMKL